MALTPWYAVRVYGATRRRVCRGWPAQRQRSS